MKNNEEESHLLDLSSRISDLQKNKIQWKKIILISSASFIILGLITVIIILILTNNKSKESKNELIGEISTYNYHNCPFFKFKHKRRGR